MKKLLIILALAVTPLFGQQKEQALEILFKNVDSSYFDADGNRWFEITMPLHRRQRTSATALARQTRRRPPEQSGCWTPATDCTTS